MSSMLKPPVQPARDLGWMQVVGLRQDDGSFWAGVRGQQLLQLNNAIPFNIGLLVVNLVAVLAIFGPAAPFASLAPWLAGIAGMAMMWSLRALRRLKNGVPVIATRARYWRVSAEILVLGISWAGLLFTLLPVLPANGQAMLLVFSLTFMGAICNAAATMPPAVLGVVGSIGGAMWLAMPAGAPLDHPLMALGLISFTMIKLRASLSTTYQAMARLKSDAELSEQGEVVRLLLNEYESNGSDWLLELDVEGRLTHVTPRFADVARRPRNQLLGQPLLSLIDPTQGGAAVAALLHAVAQRQPFRDLVVPVPLGRDLRWWSLSATPKQDGDGQFTGFRGVGREVTDVRRSQERIAQLARFDPLTGLANRSLFRELLEETVETASPSRPAALLFVDLDRFKAVNDGFGHAAGDLLLRKVAQRLQAVLKADNGRGGVTIARLGGDEFAILLPETGADRADRLAQRIVKELAKPVPLSDHGHTGAAVIGASVGWAMAPMDASEPEALLKCADLALYQVKGQGRGAACRFSAEMAEAAAHRRRMEADLAGALDRGQLALMFQPVVDAGDERITGFEALLRWHHPELGNVPPLEFIPLAEETGLIVPIGYWVIDAALGWAARWPAHVKVAVNLSAVQMDDPDLPARIGAALARHGVPANRLELEITESLFLAEKPAVQGVLATLTAMGVNFALDDFGTGYSALGTLQKASFSRIKIDRSFVLRAHAKVDEASAIIQTIVSLAASLDMATTAEGTETRAAFELCRDLGCTQVQGYLFGKPMPPEEATALVTEMASA